MDLKALGLLNSVQSQMMTEPQLTINKSSLEQVQQENEILSSDIQLEHNQNLVIQKHDYELDPYQSLLVLHKEVKHKIMCLEVQTNKQFELLENQLAKYFKLKEDNKTKIILQSSPAKKEQQDQYISFDDQQLDMVLKKFKAMKDVLKSVFDIAELDSTKLLTQFGTQVNDILQDKIINLNYSKYQQYSFDSNSKIIESPSLQKNLSQMKNFVYSKDQQFCAQTNLPDQIEIYETQTQELKQTLNNDNHSINTFLFFPSSVKKLASGGDDKIIKVWDIESGLCLRSFSGHSDSITSISISNDEKMLISGSFDKSIKAWDLVGGKCIKTLFGHDGPIRLVMFSPNNSKFISAGQDKCLKIWNSSYPFQNLQAVQNVINNLQSILSFSSGEDFLSVAGPGNSVCVLNLNDLKQYKMINYAHQEYSTCVQFSPNSQYLISGDRGGEIKLWDLGSLKCIDTLKGHQGPICSLWISAQENVLISGSTDKTIRIWPMQRKL